jgi:predicted permease
MRNLRLALRLIGRSPGFSALVVVTLALAIGATTAFYSLVEGTSLRPLPYPDGDRLAYIAETSSQNGEMAVSYPDFLDWRAAQDAFSGIAIYHSNEGTLKTPDNSELVTVAEVSREFFPVLGLHSALGRDLKPEDDVVGAAPAVWLTNQSWQRFYRGQADLVGRTIMLNGTATAVAGILPASFRFHRFADVYVAIEPIVDAQFMRERGNHPGTSVIGRLMPGVTLEAARAQMTAISKRLERQYPKSDAGAGVHVISLRERLEGDATTRLYLLLGAVVLVLVIACVNIANMLLARSFGRSREMAIRTAIGATRAELFWQLLTENLVLAVAGGVLGSFAAYWGYRFVAGLAPWEMKELLRDAGGFDARMLLVVAVLTVLTGVAFGLAPAWRLSHSNPNDALKKTQPVIRTPFGRFHTSDLLVFVQVLLAAVLLVGAGLLGRSLDRLTSVATGLRPEHVLTLRVSTPPQASMTKDPMAFIQFNESIVEKVRALPEVEAAGMASSLPYTWNTSSNSFFRTDRPTPEAGHFPSANQHVATPGYFAAMGIPLLKGAPFDGHEPRSPIPPGKPITLDKLPSIYAGFIVDVMISRKMAEKYWPGEEPIGKTFGVGLPDMHLPLMRIKGVVGNTTQVWAEQGEVMEFYTLLSQWPAAIELHLVTKVRGDPAAATASLRQAIREIAPDEPIFDVETMDNRISASSSDRRFSMELFAFFAAAALLLATTGIYGVLACYVGQRTRELGVRMALGAQQSDILLSVMARGFKVASAGVVIGLAGAWAGSSLLKSQLFDVSGTDAATYVASGLVLLAAAVVACALPARRATRLNPIEVLRAE